MRNILEAHCLLTLKVIWVLGAEDVGIKTAEGWKAAVCVGQCLRECVRGEQVESVAEASFQLSLQSVVTRLTRVLEWAVVDRAVLRQRSQQLTERVLARGRPDRAKP